MFRYKALAIVGGLAGVSAIWFASSSRGDRPALDMPYVYFDIKAIGPDGRPVNGALVSGGDSVLGVTDSFGEWRRFLRVKAGRPLTLTITKRVGAVRMAAAKTLEIPPANAASFDLEVASRLQLAVQSPLATVLKSER